MGVMVLVDERGQKREWPGRFELTGMVSRKYLRTH